MVNLHVMGYNTENGTTLINHQFQGKGRESHCLNLRKTTQNWNNFKNYCSRRATSATRVSRVSTMQVDEMYLPESGNWPTVAECTGPIPRLLDNPEKAIAIWKLKTIRLLNENDKSKSYRL